MLCMKGNIHSSPSTSKLWHLASYIPRHAPSRIQRSIAASLAAVSSHLLGTIKLGPQSLSLRGNAIANKTRDTWPKSRATLPRVKPRPKPMMARRWGPNRVGRCLMACGPFPSELRRVELHQAVGSRTRRSRYLSTDEEKRRKNVSKHYCQAKFIKDLVSSLVF